MKRKVILAESAGFCFGVQRAVDQTTRIQKEYGKRIYTLGPLIHNNDVVKFLENNEVFSISLEEINNLSKGDAVIIRSHGVSKEVMELLEAKGLIIIDATCPFVTNIQKKVNKYSKEGYQIVILGDKNHPEVIGINGWCNNNAIITKDGEFHGKVPNKVCVVSQTTEKEGNWVNTIKNLSVKTKELLAFNTICEATEIRQKGVFELSKTVDLMIVVGGKNSSNTTKLYQIAKTNCDRTIHIENSSGLPKEIINDKTISKVGITAGASTPDWIINEVVELMEGDI